MTEMSVEVSASDKPAVSLANRMLRYRWYCYGMLLLTYLFVYFDRVAPAVVAPELMKEFGLTATSLGILSSMYFYPYAAMQIPSGILSDYLGPRLSAGAFFIIAAIGTAVFGLAHSFPMIILGRFLMGIGVAVVWIPCMRILANWYRPNEFSPLTGAMQGIGNIGAVLASAPLAFLIGMIGWRSSFFGFGAFMVIIAVVDFIVIRNKPADKGFPTVSDIDGVDYYSTKNEEPVPFMKSVKVLVKLRNYKLLSVYAFVLYGTVMGFQGLWCIPYLQQIYGMPKQQAANMLMFWPIGKAVGGFSIGWAADRIFKSRRKGCLYGTIGYIISWLPMVLWPASIPVGAFYVLMLVMGFFAASTIPNYAHIAEGQPHGFIATANGMLNIWYFVGGAVFQSVMGLVLDAYGKVGDKFPVAAYRTAFLVCLVSLVIGVIAVYFTTDSNVLNKQAAK